MNKKALIAMSGGVDSSVAALLMQQQGYECIGCIMQLTDLPEEFRGSTDPVADARAVADTLGIPLKVLDLRKEFREIIIEDFIRCYRSARTPNPCIECNRCIKFGALLDYALSLGCDTLATGHYVCRQKDPETGLFVLKKASDPTKDQSYFLYSLTQEQLRHVEFPLSTYSKTKVRSLAEAHGLITARKSDSQDICFVPGGDYAAIIKANDDAPPLPGEVVDTSGRVLGTHKGLLHYTIGQRKGLGISAPEPLYVTGLEPETNRVILGSNEDLFRWECTVSRVTWALGSMPASDPATGYIRCMAKARYRHTEQPASLVPLGSDTFRLIFDEPVRALTPGQSAVFYKDDRVLGGGIID